MQKFNFKAAVLFKQKKKLKIVTLKRQKKLLRGQVFVKIIYSGICGSQLGEIDGVKGKDKYLPHLLGHEATGIVQEIGPGVKNFKILDKVILHWKISKGCNSQNPYFFFKKKKINAGKVTTFSQYSIVSENRMTKLPKDLNFKNAVVFGCAATTGYGVVNKDAKLKKDEIIVIFGCGGVGLNILHAALIKKVKKIFLFYRNKKQFSFQKKTNSILTFHYRNNLKSLKKFILKNTNNNKIDTFIDTTGKKNIIEFGLDIINDQKGKLVLVGVQNYDEKISFNTLQVQLGKKIIGSHGGGAKPNIDIPIIKKLYKNNKINLNKFYTKIYPLNGINKAILDMKKGKIQGRCLIKMH